MSDSTAYTSHNGGKNRAIAILSLERSMQCLVTDNRPPTE